MIYEADGVLDDEFSGVQMKKKLIGISMIQHEYHEF
jgi:hypothetical protein